MLLIVGAHELGWDWPYDLVHDAEHSVEDVASIGGALAWSVNTAISALVGLLWGGLTMLVVSRIPVGGSHDDAH